MNIYCGNNVLDNNLVNGNILLGTRYKCLKKGIGTGLNMPYDSKYTNDYEPIDNRKIYCGDKNSLPSEYDTFGNLPQCLQKGVAIGKRKKALKGEPFLYNVLQNKKYTYYYRFVFGLFISLIIFLILYYTKPSFVLKNENISLNNTEKIIDIQKFLILYFSIIIPVFIIIFIIDINI